MTEDEVKWLRALRGAQGEECQTAALRHLLGNEEPGDVTPALVNEPPGSYQLHDDGSVVCYWQVRAGLIPGFPDPELTRQFCLTAAELEALDGAALNARFQQLLGYAADYFQQQTNPEVMNWAALEWFWL